MDGLSDEALLERCGKIASSTWSDAMDSLGLGGLVEGLTQRGGQGRAVGFAVTAQQVAGEFGQFDRSEFGVGKLVDAARPGTMLMVTSNGAVVSSMGGIAALAASKQGATGVVIDGACRDVDEIAATGLWMATRHVTPRTGKTRLSLVEMGGSVLVGGIRVTAGDLVVADDTGIVVIPRGRIAEVLAAAEKALAVDEAVEGGVRAGKPFAEAAAAANYLPAAG
ncbi:ribonuclease E inhibitor RraA/dimethylmenaquinone methyltransferase [Stappia sp. 22II-S9-Z10]|nr:ribonuclease E inhibitor RraA/dimethylmenaquinone methyltransferase [Stappia sp. 22II-S9-Z10]